MVVHLVQNYSRQKGGALVEYAAVIALFALLILTGLPKLNTKLKQLDSNLETSYETCDGYPYPPSLIDTITCTQQLSFDPLLVADVLMAGTGGALTHP